MKTISVQKLKVGSFAKVVGITQAVFGFVYGLVLSIGVAAGAIEETTGFVQSLGVSILVIGLSVIIIPLIAYVIGWIQGAITALILNFVFAESDGLDIVIEDKK
ncbi:hypothetical protein KC950_03430 [Candidatus Saccharibacteria bacterium]|nr:hypothetical protein [Candidatus Saccharibacteria bacterium]